MATVQYPCVVLNLPQIGYIYVSIDFYYQWRNISEEILAQEEYWTYLCQTNLIWSQS